MEKKKQSQNMRKKIALIITMIIILGLTACSPKTTETDQATDSSQNSESNIESEENGESEEIADDALMGYEDLTVNSERKSTVNSDERYPLLVDYQNSSVASMEPINYINSANSGATYMIFEPLFDRLSEDEYEGRLAKSDNWIDDTHYQVEIYDYIYDTDGNNLTAADVVYSYEYYANSGSATDFEYYESVEATGDYEVTFTFTEAIDSLTAYNHMMTEVAVFTEQAATDHDFAQDPVGTGSYYLKEFVTGSHYELEANDEYWQVDELISDKCKRTVQTMHYDFITDSAMQLIAFESGAICEVELQADNLDSFLTGEYAGEYTLISRAQPSNMTIMPNMSGESVLSDDINLRLACFYALDNQAFANALGAEIYFTCSVDSSPAMSDYMESWNDIDSYMTAMDLELAKEYLEKSNYNGETLIILCDSNTRKVTMAQVMQSMLAEIGVTAEVAVYDRAMIDSYVSDAAYWDFYLYENLGSYAHLVEKLILQYSAENGNIDGESLSFIQDDTLQQMLDSCNTIEGYSQEATEEILQYLIDNAYSCGTTYSVTIKAFSKDIAAFGTPKTYGESPLLITSELYLD